jgi:hypothetical protein
MKRPPKVLNRIIDKVLSYNPKPKVLVRRDDLEIAVQYLFNRKSLPMVGADRNAGERLEAALQTENQKG